VTWQLQLLGFESTNAQATGATSDGMSFTRAPSNLAMNHPFPSSLSNVPAVQLLYRSQVRLLAAGNNHFLGQSSHFKATLDLFVFPKFSLLNNKRFLQHKQELFV
jgi:hypothetical protein